MTDTSPSSGPRAIETRYAGCHFRSRLEARWAVFFDHLGIEWEYEPQGFEIGTIDEHEPRFGYLPDFHLPELRLWVEVKPRFTGDQFNRLCWAVCPHGGGLPDHELMLLGNIPNPADYSGNCVMPGHAVLSFYKGDIFQTRTSFYVANSSNSPGPLGKCDTFGEWECDDSLWSDCGLAYISSPDTLLSATPLDLGFILKDQLDCQPARNAYNAARSARFEHGRSGAT